MSNEQKTASVTSGRVDGEVMPHDSKTLTVAFFFLAGDEPFICGVNGWATTSALDEIEREATEEKEIIFAQGDGEYLFQTARDPGQYDNEGRCEMSVYWDLRLLAYRKLEDEAQQVIGEQFRLPPY
jgi:hypothetical protein